MAHMMASMAASPPGKKRGLVALGKPVSPRVFSLPAASKANGRDGLLHPNAMPPSHGNFDWPCYVGVTDGSGDNMKQFMACYYAHLTTITPTIYYISERVCSKSHCTALCASRSGARSLSMWSVVLQSGSIRKLG